MILEIPPPLPDELIYSALSRGRYRMGWASGRFGPLLFPGRQIVVRPHLGNQLDLVASRTPWNLPATQLRDNHTLFPLVTPLLNAKNWVKCTKALHGDRVSRHHVGVCRQILGITPYTQLKSCPVCRERDRKTYGESYFHRIHQVPNINICAHDGTILEECGVTAEPCRYTALDEITEHRKLPIRDEDYVMHLRLANELLKLMLIREKPGAVAEYLQLFQSAPDRGTPILELLRVAASAEAPIPLVFPTERSDADFKRSRYHSSISTDAKWLRVVEDFLPGVVSKLQSTYRRMITLQKLQRDVERRTGERLPARKHIPTTAKFIESLVETREAASLRLARLRCMHDRQEAA